MYSFFIGLCLWFYLFRKYNIKEKEIIRQIESLQEKNNLFNYEKEEQAKIIEAIEKNILRYHQLRDVIEKINQTLDTEKVGEDLVDLVFTLIGKEKGRAILYLVDKELNLNLYKSKKEDKNLIIKTKKGDLLDWWVLKYRNPLWIEDINKDFRFDVEKLEKDRYFCSLISSPIIIQHRLLGILRLEHPQSGYFNQDDLRLLSVLADLGAIALENSQLFSQIQELAIHDSLTSLYTRTYFLEEAEKLFNRFKEGFSLLMLDIDYFKSYNDKFGHTAGDIVLKELAKTILDTLKPYSSIACRFGGEEFCIALPKVDKENALKIAESMRKRIEDKKIILRQNQTKVT
ncbi:MAG: sensor domain-containing diguanylate cyclase, partial [Candidatus Omnitrophica bacterium]|nr:sensor domain-containing diguanylate cyclase [Candidatus Omnitrophota bacterium]